MRSYWVDVNVTRFYSGALSSRSQKSVGAYCCAMKLEATLFQQIQLNNVFAQVLTGLLALMAWLRCTRFLNYEQGPTFTPEGRAEVYRMYLDSIISIAA